MCTTRVLLALFICTGATAHAQQATVVRVGDRVRASVAADQPQPHRSVGTLLAFNTSHLRIDLADGTGEIEIARSALTRLEVSRGRRSKWATGLGVGLLGGALLGAGVLSLITEPPSGLTTGDWAAVGAIFGAPTGAVVGTLIGASTRVDRWEHVPLVAGLGAAIGSARIRWELRSVRPLSRDAERLYPEGRVYLRVAVPVP